jgi:hypothetical protein
MTEQNNKSDDSFIERRKNVVERRLGLDKKLGLDRRRGPGRRRSDERKAAEEAIDTYKKANQRPFPTWTEVLEVIKALGYRKVAEPQELEAFKKDPAGANVS